MKDVKKCKGTGRANGHGCGKLVPVVMYNAANRIYGLGKSCGCYTKWLLKEGMDIVEKATLKATKPRRDLEARSIEYMEQKSLPALLTNVKTVVHKTVRLRDKGKPCISCGCAWNESFQAGHCYAAGDYSTIRYHLQNIHGQCKGCNLTKNGNETEYQLRLPYRIGQEAFDELSELAKADRRTDHKWDREELYRIRSEANDIYKQLKSKA